MFLEKCQAEEKGNNRKNGLAGRAYCAAHRVQAMEYGGAHGCVGAMRSGISIAHGFRGIKKNCRTMFFVRQSGALISFSSGESGSESGNLPLSGVFPAGSVPPAVR